MFQPLATCFRRQNELIDLAITQVVEFPPAVGIGTLADHSEPRSILATQVDSLALRDLFGSAVSKSSSILSELASNIWSSYELAPVQNEMCELNEVANRDRLYLLSSPEDDSQDRSRTVDGRR